MANKKVYTNGVDMRDNHATAKLLREQAGNKVNALSDFKRFWANHLENKKQLKKQPKVKTNIRQESIDSISWFHKFNVTLGMLCNRDTGKLYGFDGIKFNKEVNGYSFTKGNKKVNVRFSEKVDPKSKPHVSKSNNGENTIWVGSGDTLDFELIRDTIADYFGSSFSGNNGKIYKND